MRVILTGAQNEIDFIKNCKYSNFLKCPNVQYIQLDKKNLTDILQIHDVQNINVNKAKVCIKNIGMQHHNQYDNHHNITNEWSILKWSDAILKDESDYPEEIDGLNKKLKSDLYFEYLRFLFSNSTQKISQKELELKNSGSVLYIDDQAHDGWNELLCDIFTEEDNEGKVYFDTPYEIKYKRLQRNEIEQAVLDHVKKRVNEDKSKYHDVVLLDLRLCEADKSEKDIKKLTGYQILKKIKELNKGIQVIIFSASNKLWNLQELQIADADGFISKEAPENSYDEDFTVNAIESLVKNVDIALERKFLKPFYQIQAKMQSHLNLIDDDIEENQAFNSFIRSLRTQHIFLGLGLDSVDIKIQPTLDSLFFVAFKFFEIAKDYYIHDINDSKKGYGFFIGWEKHNGVELMRYKNPCQSPVDFNRLNTNDKPSLFQSVAGIMADYLNCFKDNDEKCENLKSLKNLARDRNDFIHKPKIKGGFNKTDIKKILSLLDKLIANIKE